MSLRRLDEFAFVYEKVASYANFRASFSSVLIMAEESSHSQDLNNAFIIERTPTKGTKRKKYTLDFKCKVIEAAKNSPSSRAVALQYGIHESILRDWKKNEGKIRNTLDHQGSNSKRMRIEGAGRKFKDEDLDCELTEWIVAKRTENLCVTRKQIRQKALESANEKGNTDFKASEGWCTKFMKRNGFCIRRKTSQSQRLPSELCDKIVQFFTYDRQYFKTFPKIQEHNIVAMDETSVLLENVSSSTVTSKGEKAVVMKTTGHEKAAVTVLLTGRSNGKRCIPTIIFAGKGCTKMDKELKSRRDIKVVFRDTAWCNESVIADWIPTIFPSLFPKRTLLVWDSFRAHLTENTKSLLQQRRVDTIVIPGGLTGLIQCPDLCWNKPFKDRLREKYNTWLESAPKTFTTHGNMRAPSRKEICDMVVESWSELPEELIINLV